MHWFYKPDLNITASDIIIEDTEAHHCNVLRIMPEEKVGITDGKGNVVIAYLKNKTKQICLFKVIKIIKNYNKRFYFLHIAIAPPKNIDRFEFFIEKSTEIGIDRITPIYTKRTERRKIRTDRLEKIAIAAIKQSHNAYKPTIDQIISFEKFIEIENTKSSQKFITVCNAEQFLLNTINFDIKKFIVIIGPEGGFEQYEIEKAKLAGYKAVKLANNILRTETAGIVATTNFILKF